MRHTRVWCGLWAGALVGCKAVEPAPTALDDLAHYFWDNHENPDSEQVASAIANLYDAVDAKNLDGSWDGSITDLTQDQLALVGKESEDASAVAGIFMANVIDCPLSAVKPLVYALNQDELHPGSYKAYERSYTTDVDAYEAGETDVVGWQSNYTVSYVGKEYSAVILASLRDLPDVDDEITPHGESFLVRGVLRDPAPFTDNNALGLFQDYQMEVYFQRSARETIHFYIIWRDFWFSDSSNFDDEVLQRFVLNGLAGWDKDLEGLCAE